MATEGIRFRIRVPGSTSNLGSGFDALSAALSIYLTVDVHGSDNPGIHWPEGWTLSPHENVLLRAMQVTSEYLRFPLDGLRLDVDNQIPLRRGLGSSAAAIICGIKVVERLAGHTLTQHEILDLAFPLEGHPDNLAASLLGGWVLSTVTGNTARAENLSSRLSCRFVVVIPEITVSTREARRILPQTYSLEQAVFNVQRAALFVHALASGRSDLVEEATRDCLHQPFRAQLVPGMQLLLHREGVPAELKGDLLSVTISGSGSAVVALATGQFDTVGEWMQSVLAKAGVNSRCVVLDLDSDGPRISMPRDASE